MAATKNTATTHGARHVVAKSAASTNSKESQISLASSLAVAACSCLGVTASNAANAQESDNLWDFNTAILYYGESDDRVQDASLAIYAQRHYSDERNLNLSLTVDTLTGASASGAIALDRPQTFTSPSGNATYTTPANDVPLDDTFLDTRVAVTASWSQPVGDDMQTSFGVSLSKEYDYVHLGGNASLAKNFNKNNTTLSAGLAFSMDSWDVVGGAPVGLSEMGDIGDLTNRLDADQDKDIVDVLVGVSQVINKNLVAQLNYSYSDSSGYLNDPYKIISVVDAISGDTVMRPAIDEGPDGVYLFEQRPDSRTKHSIYGQLKYYLSGRVLDASYRYMTDDWEIDSHTLEARYRVPLSSIYIEPHVRFYTQTEAEFYRASIAQGGALPQFASADYRLGNFDALTVGLKVGGKRANGHSWSTRLEYYTQRGDVPSEQIIGNQANRVQYPDLNAIIAQFSYKFGY